MTSFLRPTSEPPVGYQAGSDPPRVLSHRARARRRRRRRRRAGLAVSVIVVLAAVTGISVVLASHHPAAPVVSACVAAPVGGTVKTAGAWQITPDQAQNAAIIAAVAQKMGLADHAVTIALATALQESRLTDLPYGDLDSVGLFQQRPSQGWGSPTQLLDPVYAASAFYGRLTEVSGWEELPVTVAAQDVQRSADPTAYAAWEPEARAMAADLTGETPAGFTCRLAGFGGADPAPGALAAAATTEMGSNLLGVPVGVKVGWRVAAWAVAHSWQYHLSRVAFDGWSWTPGSGRWVRTAPGAGAADTVQVS